MLLTKPTEAEVRAFLAVQSKLQFSYTEVGASRGGAETLPANYPVNRYRGKLGAGREAFDRAVVALRSWEMYSLGWTKLYWPDTPIREGAVVAILARHFGLWSLNACRIVYTLEEETDVFRRSGFAFGTLPGHVEIGEERFTVEWDERSGEVWYELFAFARPKLLAAKVAYPLVRSTQKRFAAASFAAMARAVERHA